jgi:hypothetical protein
MIDTEVNIPLLRKAVEWAEAEAAKPEVLSAWDQGNWVRTRDERLKRMSSESRQEYAECGTTYCIAGYVTAGMQGMTFDDGYNDGGEHVADIAAGLLGIAPPRDALSPEPGHLFHMYNDATDVRRIAESIAGERL